MADLTPAKPVTCMHNLHFVRKLDRRELAMLKHKARMFMDEGRYEFAFQLGKWQDLFLEN